MGTSHSTFTFILLCRGAFFLLHTVATAAVSWTPSCAVKGFSKSRIFCLMV